MTKGSRNKLYRAARGQADSRLGFHRDARTPCALAIFARPPTPGRAKTRLAPLLGSRGSAEFQAALIADTIRKVNSLKTLVALFYFLAGRNFPNSPSLSRFTLGRQRGADLGERLARAFGLLLRRHDRVVVIGTDSPALTKRVLRQAFRELRVCDSVLGPCPDGGFYLVGLRRPAGSKRLFSGVSWGSASAFRELLRNLLANDYSCSVLEPCGDVDRPQDLRQLMKELARDHSARRLSPAVWRFLKCFRIQRP